MGIARNGRIFGRLVQRLVRRFAWDRRGNIAPLVVLLIVPLAALMGVATEGGGWFLIQRAAQNAADSAVIAAATNGGNGGTNYATEGQSVASSYGFVNGTNNATVTIPTPATYGSVTSCASSPCYRATVTKAVPLYLLHLVYSGDTAVNGVAGQTITATALATTKTVNVPFCLLGLQNSGKPAIYANGIPNANLSCNVMSNGDSKCNGNSVTTGISNSGGTNTGSKDCGAMSNDNQPPQSDPYAYLSSDIPTAVSSVPNNCTTGSAPTYYPQTNSNWPSGTNTLTSSTLPAVSVFCGDLALGGNLTVSTASPGSLIIIENGMLNLNGFTLRSGAGSGLTIIFSSPQGSAEAYTSGGTPTNFVCTRPGCANGGNGGLLDISSPTSGTWSGIALYQDLNLPLQGPSQCTGGDLWAYNGSSPTWDISGVVDLSRTNLCVSGAIGQSTNGAKCLTLVANTAQLNGTGNLFYQNDQSQCAQQGVTQIMGKGYVVGQLVY